MDSGKSSRNLAVSFHSLLGLEAHLTSNWVKSVSEIIKTLPSEKSVDMQPTKSDTDDDGDSISKIQGKRKTLVFFLPKSRCSRVPYSSYIYCSLFYKIFL